MKKAIPYVTNLKQQRPQIGPWRPKSEDSEMSMLRLQNQVSQRGTAVQMTTNISKK
jgi:hypothetical protein